MDPAAMAAAAAADPMLHALPVAPVFIAPPSYETTLAMATTTIAILPSLHPRPNHSSIRALERNLFDKLQAIQSSQSEEWGFRGLAEQPAEYALKSATPWTDAPNPGPHRPVGLNAQLTRDAETIFDSAKMDYLSQLNVTQAIINALNVAVPKEFKRGATAAGTIMGASPYRNNNNPRTILLALRDLYGRPSPAEKQANNTTFAAPWNPAEPIETYFDRLEDCYVTALIASPPFTMAQMIDMAIMTLQVTGLYSRALTEWEAMPPAAKTWDILKNHFAAAYNLRLISGTTTAGQAGYHRAANAIDNDDTINNIEHTLNHELSNLQLANNANQQSTQQMFAAFTQQIASLTQQMANFTPHATPPPLLAPAIPGHHPAPHGSRHGRNRGRGRGPNHIPLLPITANSIPTPIVAAIGIPTITPTHSRAPNNNKWFNNHNYCFSCGYDVPIWHTSATCPDPKRNHQAGCTRQNVTQYEALGHLASKKAIHKTLMPTNPGPTQA